MGIVSVALIGPNLIKSFRDLGIDQATIKYTAQYRAENKLAKVKQVLATEILFEVVIGLALSVSSFLLSDFMAVLLERPTIAPLIQIASIIIFAEALLKASQVAFTGYEQMGFYSISMVIQSTVKTGLMVFLVMSGYGPIGATIGDTASYMIAGSFSIILVYLVLYSKLHEHKGSLEIFSTLKYMAKYGIPVSIAWTINAFLTQFYSFLLAIYSTDVIMGNYQIALSFAVIVTFFVVPLNTILFPAFSKINAQTERETLKSVFKSSVKYATLIVIPATMAVMVLAEPATSTIFGEKYELTPLYLAMYVGIYFYTALGSLSAGNLINSQGRTEVNLKFTLITAAMGLSLSLLLVPPFGVIGLLVTYLIAGIPSTLLALWWIKKHYGASIDWGASAKIVLTSVVTSLITYVLLSQIEQANWITLIIGAIIFLAVYTVTAPILGAVDKKDIQYLKDMVSALGPLAPIVSIPLIIAEQVAKTFQKTKSNY
jgi:PST family polysaccharide transporter